MNILPVAFLKKGKYMNVKYDKLFNYSFQVVATCLCIIIFFQLFFRHFQDFNLKFKNIQNKRILEKSDELFTKALFVVVLLYYSRNSYPGALEYKYSSNGF